MATEKTIVLITGGNTGIGFETVKALYASPITDYTILMGSRSLEKADAAIASIEAEIPRSASEMVAVQIDIEDDASIGKCFETIKAEYGRLDVLVNNAGGSFDAPLTATPDGPSIRAAFNANYTLNVTSTEVVTRTLMPLLLTSSPSPSQPRSTPRRLIFLTSGLASLTTTASGKQAATAAGPPPPGWPKPPSRPTQMAYRMSKAALNMQMLEWARLLASDGVRVFAVSPGFLATGLAGLGREKMRALGAGDPAAGGELLREVVEGGRDGDAGLVVEKGGVQPW